MVQKVNSRRRDTCGYWLMRKGLANPWLLFLGKGAGSDAAPPSDDCQTLCHPGNTGTIPRLICECNSFAISGISPEHRAVIIDIAHWRARHPDQLVGLGSARHSLCLRVKRSCHARVCSRFGPCRSKPLLIGGSTPTHTLYQSVHCRCFGGRSDLQEFPRSQPRR